MRQVWVAVAVIVGVAIILVVAAIPFGARQLAEDALLVGAVITAFAVVLQLLIWRDRLLAKAFAFRRRRAAGSKSEEPDDS